jgi:hypothetical protein
MVLEVENPILGGHIWSASGDGLIMLYYWWKSRKASSYIKRIISHGKRRSKRNLRKLSLLNNHSCGN